METINKVFLKGADCALDLGDGSERAPYVNQDYILRKLGSIHRGISLMYTYYPKDKGWPQRASIAFPQKDFSGAWNYPYEDYFPYRGGVEGLRDDEPFKFMREVRAHGQDVVLTLTIDPSLTDDYLITLAEDLRPYGRLLLRINHECTGTWFCFNKRASYEELAAFFVRCCRVFHEHAPNIKLILCAGMWDEKTGKVEMEDIFLEAFKEADIWSGDRYLSLHFGWPGDVALKGGTTFYSGDVDEIYNVGKKTWKRLKEITGQEKPMVLSELNADGDVNGPFEQAAMMKHFMELLQKDKEKWLSGLTMYQFRDDGRLGLELTDPNNSDVGIEQPLMPMYKEQLHRPFFSPKIEVGGKTELPVKLRWGGSQDSEGFEMTVRLSKKPHYAEVYFDGDLLNMNLIVEVEGYWFYKKPGVKCIDLMTCFFEKPLPKSKEIKIRFFAPPADGMNRPSPDVDPYKAEIGPWINDFYSEIKHLPRLRFEEEPVLALKRYSK